MEKINKITTELLKDVNVCENHEQIEEYKKNVFNLIDKIDTLLIDFENDNDIDLLVNDGPHYLIQLIKAFKGGY